MIRFVHPAGGREIPLFLARRRAFCVVHLVPITMEETRCEDRISDRTRCDAACRWRIGFRRTIRCAPCAGWWTTCFRASRPDSPSSMRTRAGRRFLSDVLERLKDQRGDLTPAWTSVGCFFPGRESARRSGGRRRGKMASRAGPRTRPTRSPKSTRSPADGVYMNDREPRQRNNVLIAPHDAGSIDVSSHENVASIRMFTKPS